MESSFERVKRRYNRYSKVYDALEYPLERLWFSTWRKRLLRDIEGLVLEIGMGTGKNLKHYPHRTRIIGIDISDGMLSRARRKAEGQEVCLVLASGERLPFKPGVFSVIVLTYVLCSVPDPVKSLREAARVLGSGGEVRMLEHVLSRNRFLALLERIHSPVTRWLFGFNMDRDTPGNVRESGLMIVEEENLAARDIFKRIKAKTECI